MKITHIEFKRPLPCDIERKGEHEWSFIVDTDEELPHGYNGFGGILKRIGDDVQGYLWQARAHVAENFGVPARTREAAIDCCLAGANSALQAWKEKETETEERRQNRFSARTRLADLMPKNSNVRVFLENPEQLDETPRYTINMVGMSKSHVEQWACLMATFPNVVHNE